MCQEVLARSDIKVEAHHRNIRIDRDTARIACTVLTSIKLYSRVPPAGLPSTALISVQSSLLRLGCGQTDGTGLLMRRLDYK